MRVNMHVWSSTEIVAEKEKDYACIRLVEDESSLILFFHDTESIERLIQSLNTLIEDK